jgi:hypothetical protein
MDRAIPGSIDRFETERNQSRWDYLIAMLDEFANACRASYANLDLGYNRIETSDEESDPSDEEDETADEEISTRTEEIALRPEEIPPEWTGGPYLP